MHTTARRLCWAFTWIVIFAVALIFLATGCAPSTGADAKTAEDGKVANGRITNDPKSKGSIRVYRSWSADPTKPAGKAQTLRPGGETNMTLDFDGYCSDRAAEATVYWGAFSFKVKTKPGECAKIRDGQHAVVRVG